MAELTMSLEESPCAPNQKVFIVRAGDREVVRHYVDSTTANDLQKVVKERDEVRAEVERLRGEMDES